MLRSLGPDAVSRAAGPAAGPDVLCQRADGGGAARQGAGVLRGAAGCAAVCAGAVP